MVGARLERDVEGRPGRIVAALGGVAQRGDLGVQPAELGVMARPEQLAVTHDHGSDERVRAHLAASALGELEGVPEVDPIFGRGRGTHTD